MATRVRSRVRACVRARAWMLMWVVHRDVRGFHGLDHCAGRFGVQNGTCDGTLWVDALQISVDVDMGAGIFAFATIVTQSDGTQKTTMSMPPLNTPASIPWTPPVAAPRGQFHVYGSTADINGGYTMLGRHSEKPFFERDASGILLHWADPCLVRDLAVASSRRVVDIKTCVVGLGGGGAAVQDVSGVTALQPAVQRGYR